MRVCDARTEMDEQEQRLAEIVMSSCTPYGDERASELSASLVALMDYGCHYMARAEQMEGLEQKAYYIKSAALLAASKSRCELLSDTLWCREVLEIVKLLHTSILRNLNCDEKSDLILEAIDTVKKRLICLRETQSGELEAVGENHPPKEEIKFQKRKIETVRTLLEKTTKDYGVLMHYIAGKCQSILGDAPCKFSLVGLGSLAKREITLYSDFNYVIVLEEGVQYRGMYEEILEYFRWFAVLFQVIIIGVGETLLTSIGIECLVDFFDAYTPSGIAIDGLMPLVCEMHTLECVPLTAVTTATEFIRPVKYMASLWSLCKSTEIGFKLKNLLRNFCFVYGSDDVYKQFSELAYENLFSKHTTLADPTLLPSWNMDQILRESPYMKLDHPQMTSCSLFYQPISLCLSYIATVFNWKCLPGFEIISKLKKFSSDLAVIYGRPASCHGIELALAVACELRMKFYALGNGSRLKIVCGDIFDLIDERCLRTAIYQIWTLSTHLRVVCKYVESGKLGLHGVKPNRINIDFGKSLENSLKEQLSILERDKNLTTYDKRYILHNCIHAIRHLLKGEGGPHRELLDTATRYVLRHPGYIENETATRLLVSLYLDQEKYGEALKVCEKHFVKFPFGDPRNTFRLRRYQMTSLLYSRTTTEAIRYCDVALATFKDLSSQLTFCFGRIIAGDYFGKRQGLAELVDDVKENVRYFKPTDILFFLQEIFVRQYGDGCFEDAVRTVEVAILIMQTKVQYINPLKFVRLLGEEAAQCYLELLPKIMDSYKAVGMLSKVLNLCIQAGFREDVRGCYVQAIQHLHDRYQTKPAKHVLRLIHRYLAVVRDNLNFCLATKQIMQFYETSTSESEPPSSGRSVYETPKSTVGENNFRDDEIVDESESNKKSEVRQHPNPLGNSLQSYNFMSKDDDVGMGDNATHDTDRPSVESVNNSVAECLNSHGLPIVGNSLNSNLSNDLVRNGSPNNITENSKRNTSSGDCSCSRVLESNNKNLENTRWRSESSDSDVHSHNEGRTRSRSSADDSERIDSVTSFKIDVKFTQIGRTTNIRLVARERETDQ